MYDYNYKIDKLVIRGIPNEGTICRVVAFLTVVLDGEVIIKHKFFVDLPAPHDGFIPLDQLTEDQIIEWVDAKYRHRVEDFYQQYLKSQAGEAGKDQGQDQNQGRNQNQDEEVILGIHELPWYSRG